VLAELRARQKREGGTLGDLASRLLAVALSDRGGDRGADAPVGLQWPAADLGLLVDLEDDDAVERALGGDQ
jgi:hypothetical protein